MKKKNVSTKTYKQSIGDYFIDNLKPNELQEWVGMATDVIGVSKMFDSVSRRGDCARLLFRLNNRVLPVYQVADEDKALKMDRCLVNFLNDNTVSFYKWEIGLIATAYLSILDDIEYGEEMYDDDIDMRYPVSQFMKVASILYTVIELYEALSLEQNKSKQNAA